MLYSFKRYEHFNFRACPVINRVKIDHIYQHSHVSKSWYFFILGSWVTFIGFFLLFRWYNWWKWKRISFLAFFRFREAFKKKRCEKMQFFRILGPRFNFNAKKCKFPGSCRKFNSGCWCPRAIFYAEKNQKISVFCQLRASENDEE